MDFIEDSDVLQKCNKSVCNGYSLINKFLAGIKDLKIK